MVDTAGGFLGADVDGLDQLAQGCATAADTTDQVVAVLVPLVREPWGSGPFYRDFIRYLADELGPALSNVKQALDRFEFVVRAHAYAQRRISEGKPVDVEALPHYTSVLANTGGGSVSRDPEANKQLVERELAEKQADLALSRAMLADAREGVGGEVSKLSERVQSLERVESNYEELLKDDVRILEFDPDAHGGDGSAIALITKDGLNPDIKNATVFAQGMTSDIKNFGAYVDRARERVYAYEEGEDHAMVVWMGADQPDGLLEAASNRLARAGAPALAAFTHEFRQDLRDAGAENANLNLYGHSAAGPMAGLAVSQGADVDRMLYHSTAGMGPGIDSVDDLHNVDRDGDGTHDPLAGGIHSMTPAGDSIELAQGQPFNPHGADPDGGWHLHLSALPPHVRIQDDPPVPGVNVLRADDVGEWPGVEGGSWWPGNQIHSHYGFDPTTEGWREINAVLNGERDPQ